MIAGWIGYRGWLTGLWERLVKGIDEGIGVVYANNIVVGIVHRDCDLTGHGYWGRCNSIVQGIMEVDRTCGRDLTVLWVATFSH